MNHYVMHDIETDRGEPNDPKMMAKCYTRVEAEMLVALLKYESPFDKNTTYGPRFFIVRESEIDHEHLHRRAVAAFEVDGPDPRDAVEIEILRTLLGREEDEGDLRRTMVQRVLVEDAGMDHFWKDKILVWIMRFPKPALAEFEHELGALKAEDEAMFGAYKQQREADAPAE